MDSVLEISLRPNTSPSQPSKPEGFRTVGRSTARCGQASATPLLTGEWGIRPALANVVFARSGPAPRLATPSMALRPCARSNDRALRVGDSASNPPFSLNESSRPKAA